MAGDVNCNRSIPKQLNPKQPSQYANYSLVPRPPCPAFVTSSTQLLSLSALQATKAGRGGLEPRGYASYSITHDIHAHMMQHMVTVKISKVPGLLHPLHVQRLSNETVSGLERTHFPENFPSTKPTPFSNF